MSNENVTRIKRETADRLLKEAVVRIGEVNADDQYALVVSRAVVFGSYVNNPEYETFGDVDIGLQFSPRYSDPVKHKIKLEARRAMCTKGDWLYQLCWPQEEMCIRIMNRNPYIALCLMGSQDEAIFSKKIMELPLDGDTSKLNL